MTTRTEALVHLKTMVASCQGCGLSETRTQTVFSRGDGSSGLLVVGEAPGAEEDAAGEPFVGDSGRILDKMLASIGLDPKTVYICNVVKCRPPANRTPNVAEKNACAGYLYRQIGLVKPKVIVTLGKTAGECVLAPLPFPGMVSMRGKWQYAMGCDVMPTFHPAYLFRVQSAKALVFEDMKVVAERLGLAR